MEPEKQPVEENHVAVSTSGGSFVVGVLIIRDFLSGDYIQVPALFGNSRGCNFLDSAVARVGRIPYLEAHAIYELFLTRPIVPPASLICCPSRK